MAKKIAIAILAMVVISKMTMPVSARTIGYFEDFVVYFSGTDSNDKYTSWITKKVTNRDAVVNLSETTANGKNITVLMRNANGEVRGSTTLNVGTRKQFASTGVAYYEYRLGMRKTYNYDGLTATLYGSWSPDYK